MPAPSRTQTYPEWFSQVLQPKQTQPFANTVDDSDIDSRTIEFKNLTPYKGNEYNIAIVDENDAPVPESETVPGVVDFGAYSPGADRPEAPSNTVDLSTGTRKFTLFFASIERTVFSVTGLPANRRVIVTAIRSDQYVR